MASCKPCNLLQSPCVYLTYIYMCMCVSRYPIPPCEANNARTEKIIGNWLKARGNRSQVGGEELCTPQFHGGCLCMRGKEFKHSSKQKAFDDHSAAYGWFIVL